MLFYYLIIINLKSYKHLKIRRKSDKYIYK